jgi:hypothetical protein
VRTLLRRRRRTGDRFDDADARGMTFAGRPVNGVAVGEPDPETLKTALRVAQDERAAAIDRAAELERQLAKAEVKAKYLTLGDLDRSLKWAGIENGLNGVHSLGLDGPRGDMGGALEVVIHRYTLDAYGARHWVASHEDGAVLDDGRPDGSTLPGGIAAETRRFLLRRDGGLDPR